MITKKELQEYAKIKSLNLGNAEKDYLIDIALLSISQHTKNEIVFKGGTCLYKFHKLERFSEDLDFSAVKEIDVNSLIENVIRDFRKYGINAEARSKKPHNSMLTILRVEGPLYTGKPATLASLSIDINFKSPAELDPEILSYSSMYPEISQVNALCMKPEEIFAEKVRVIMTRKKARDLFDLHFLLQRGVCSSLELVNKKMQYYNEVFDIKKFKARIKMLEAQWKKELEGFTPSLPEFTKAKKEVEKETGRFCK